MIAALMDAATILVASFVGVGSAVIEVVGIIIQKLGEVLFFLPGVGSQLQALGKQWREFGNQGVEASAGVIEGVLQGEGALGRFNDRVLETNAILEKAAKNGAFSTVEAEIVRLLEAQRKAPCNPMNLPMQVIKSGTQ